MISLSGQYALRAMIYLAQHAADCPIPGRVIAGHTDIPAKYLSKILGDLVRRGVLQSSRGKTGGFSLRLSSKRTRLYDVLAPFEQLEYRQCPFGNQRCSDTNPCLAHERFKRVVQAETDFLTHCSLYSISHEERAAKAKPRAARTRKARKR